MTAESLVLHIVQLVNDAIADGVEVTTADIDVFANGRHYAVEGVRDDDDALTSVEAVQYEPAKRIVIEP